MPCELKLNGLVSLMWARAAAATGRFRAAVRACIAAGWTNTSRYAYVLTVGMFLALSIYPNIIELLHVNTVVL